VLSRDAVLRATNSARSEMMTIHTRVERARETSVTLGEVRGFHSRAAQRHVVAAQAHDNERSDRA